MLSVEYFFLVFGGGFVYCGMATIRPEWRYFFVEKEKVLPFWLVFNLNLRNGVFRVIYFGFWLEVERLVIFFWERFFGDWVDVSVLITKVMELMENVCGGSTFFSCIENSNDVS